MPDSLHLAVALFDHCVNSRTISSHCYRLYGFTALWIALKYEERSVPMLTVVLTAVKPPFDADTVRNCERLIFHTLMQRLDLPTDMVAYGNLMRMGMLRSTTHRQLVTMLLEVALFYRERMQFTPWHRACAALYLARLIRPETSIISWSIACDIATKSSLKAITPAIRFLYKALTQASSVIRRKYSQVFPSLIPGLPL